jgi:hypothetical protein
MFFTELALAVKNLSGGFLVPLQVADCKVLGPAGSCGTTSRLAIETW